jgi:acyl carrier protein
MSNRDKLKKLLMDIFLLSESEFHFDLKRDDILTWDSLGTVSMAVGVQETFGYHFPPAEAMSVQGVPDIIRILESKGIAFND